MTMMQTTVPAQPSFVPFEKEEIETSIPARFEKQVARYPDYPAIEINGQIVTYSQLNQAANQVARIILAQTTANQQSVALLFEPSINMVVAMLAVLKAGKLWVPIDPAYPQARISYILNDAQASVLLTNDDNIELAQSLSKHQAKLINIDQIANDLPDHNLDLKIAADALACITYTSGSTGQPKGVVQDHRNWLHLIWHYASTIHVSPTDRASLIPSYSHVSGVTSIFRALLNGATVLPYNLKKRGLIELAGWLREEQITIFNTVPTVFRHLAQTLKGDETFSKLRLVFVAGEALYKRDVELFQKHFPQTCSLVNTLGCTELPAYRQFFITSKTKLDGNIVPVGYEVEDRAALVVDDNGNQVGVDEIGEIALKSPYLALGYWRQPELTAQKFLPAADGSGERMYLTGDMGRLLPDGCLIHLGRKDFQVQIRGYRVEIGEIETLLRDHPHIKEAVVAALENEAQEKYLVAYLVAKPNQLLQTTELRNFLQKKLPDYMLPSSFVIVEALPLTPNGKIDRKMLPTLQAVATPAEPAKIGSRTEWEQRLVEIWQTTLKLEQVGIHDNFFELGGHSLLAARVVSRLFQEYGIELPMRHLFEYRTIAELAPIIEEMVLESGN